MSIRFQADNDLRKVIVDATLRRELAIDFSNSANRQTGGVDDDAVLWLAAEQGRLLVTHDKRTMPKRLAEFIDTGHQSPGVLLVIPQSAATRDIVDTLILIWTDNQPAAWTNVLAKIPF